MNEYLSAEQAKAKSSEELASSLKTSKENGLNIEEVNERRGLYGA